MKLFSVLTIAALAASTACSNTAAGVKKDAEKAADKTADAAATAGAAVDAATQTAQVKTALATDSRVDASDINVDTDKDLKTVTLKGTVPVDAQRNIAADIATAKATGYQIVNQLTVKPK
jgi:osmotically-inducible protein OsmY